MCCIRALFNEIFAPLVISFSNSDTPNNEFSYQHQIDPELHFFLQDALAQKPIMKIA